MPRVSREQSEVNRRSITEASARLFREHGIKGISVSDLMAAAGLTHGGFYGHFESKDALAAEACAWAFQHSVERWNKRVAGQDSAESGRTALVEAYLSATSRANPGTSCPTTALAGDVARENPDAPVRAAFASGIEGLMRVLASLEQTGSTAADRCAALADFSTMVGALMLARATSGQGISDEILDAARQRLISKGGPPRRNAPRRNAPRRSRR
jgi:TetR/AcrR family transcriptional regulator, transcriptional repressor for nem operon